MIKNPFFFWKIEKIEVKSRKVPAVAANIQDEKFSRFPRTKPINIPTNASTDDTTL